MPRLFDEAPIRALRFWKNGHDLRRIKKGALKRDLLLLIAFLKFLNSTELRLIMSRSARLSIERLHLRNC